MGRLSKPTIRDVANMAGVSPATVSYVLAGRSGGSARISEPTKERVLLAAKELGYVASIAARGMRRGRTDTVAVAIENMDAPWGRALAQTANRMLPAHGYRVVILLGQEAWRNFMLSGGADGAILGFSTETEDEKRTILGLAKRGVAQVVVSQFMEPDGFDVLSVDPAPGIADAAAYLAGRHKRIAVIHGAISSPGLHGTMLDLFRAGLEQTGTALDETLVRASAGSWRRACDEALELLALPDPPTAFFATADLEARCVSGAAMLKGIAVPEHLEIIAVENPQLGQNTDLPLATVVPGPTEHLAVDLLLARLKGEAPEAGLRIPVPWTLHHRRSVHEALQSPISAGV
ncbi:LacI family DNA-binding transcriptional regulator [Arthrobacter crystallopoietes]|uniref:LacI family DNA-binding transcriptional regulator n=1 Tax=Crystallibacter crystallopoietes TaxID=37928 RepID=UPI0011113299|nr:LacI family DNA-binding transcriptional regulator [Arthrobacter crystallopoietes]